MEKKYYDLIISLIKEHKKFSGYEAILEDIANDVFEHSKVVINAINNDEVVVAYLNKVISTSIVTVPKKLNYNTRVNHRVITTIVPESTVVVEPQQLIQPKIEQESIAEELLTKDVEQDVETEPELLAEELLQEDVEQDAETEPELLAEDFLQEDVELDVEPDHVIVDEPVVEAEIDSLPDDSFEETVEEVLPTVSDVDKTLVDRMINGVSESSEPAEEIVPVEHDEFAGLSEVYESLDDVEPLEESSFEDMQEESVEEFVEPEAVVEELDLQPEVVEETSLDIVEDTLSEEVSDVENLVETFDSGDVDSLVLDEGLSSFDGDELQEYSDFDELGQIESAPEEFDTESVEESGVAFEPETEGCAVPTYDCFSFEPQKPVYDAEEILSYLKEIDNKYPERQILTICNLKYHQKLSVIQIAEKLALTEDAVLETLNQIIDAIKD